MIFTGVQWNKAMEIGEEYTFIRFTGEGNKAVAVCCKVLTIQANGTCTVEVMSASTVHCAWSVGADGTEVVEIMPVTDVPGQLH